MGELVETERFCSGCLKSVKVTVVEGDILSRKFKCQKCKNHKGKRESKTNICSEILPDLPISTLKKCRDIGSGAHGKVYRVKYDGADRAVKLFSWGEDSDLNFRICRIFDKEITALSKLRHDNIVRFYGKESIPGQHPALMMEFCEFQGCVGQTKFTLTNLRQAIENVPLGGQSCFDFVVFVRLAIDICRGMRFMHGTEPIITHRDLKPENILISNRDAQDLPCTKICDFSLCKLGSEISQVSSVGPAFSIYKDPLPPTTDLTADWLKKADVYSFGWILLEMLSGQLSKWRKEINKSSVSKGSDIIQCLREGKRDAALLRILKTRNIYAAELAMCCFHWKWQYRPEFGDIFVMLKNTREEELNRLDKIKFKGCSESTFEYLRRHKADKYYVWHVLDDRDMYWLHLKKELKAREDHNRVQSFSKKSLELHIDHGSTADATDQMYISTSKDLEWIFGIFGERISIQASKSH